jgi:mannose/fructose/N-acetylgalactosamine-specific phosphotransferase system component IIC
VSFGDLAVAGHVLAAVLMTVAAILMHMADRAMDDE